MRRVIWLVFILLFAITLAGCGQAKKERGSEQVTVSAAKGLTKAMEEIQADYQKTHPDVQIQLNFGASGSLRQQIEQGAPVDIFISADRKTMDEIEAKGMIDQASRKNMVGDRLVLVTGKDAGIKTLEELASEKVIKLAIGDPAIVPVGTYAKEALENSGLWGKVQSKLLFAKDVRQVVTYVATGNAEAGIAYQSVARTEPGLNLIEIPANLHTPVVFPGALTTRGKENKEAASFMDYLLSPEATGIFKKHGFVPLE